MDLSALIFVALAVAWAAYLIPKALKHHEEVQRSRSVDKFSSTMRVLARREPVSARTARLVVTPGRTPSAPVVHTKGPAPTVAAVAAQRAAAARAARRRRNVLTLVLLANVVVAAVAAAGVIGWWWTAAPATLLVAWLVACRLMVKKERRVRLRRPASRSSESAIPLSPQAEPLTDDEAETSASLPVVPSQPGARTDTLPSSAESATSALEDTGRVEIVAKDPSMWDMIPVTLPTYVSKPLATRRTVHTIDLDSTGVWTSGRTDSDAAIVRAAEESDRAAKAADSEAPRRRATGT